MPISYKDARATRYWRAVVTLAENIEVMLDPPAKPRSIGYRQHALNWEADEHRPRYAHLLRFLYEAFTWAKPPLTHHDEAQWEALCRKRLDSMRPRELSYAHKKLLGQVKSKKKEPALPLLDQPGNRSVAVESYQAGKQLPIFRAPYNELTLFS